MAKITIVIMFLGLLIFFSHLLSKMFDKTKIPNVLILMLIGIAAGFFVDDTIFFLTSSLQKHQNYKVL